MDPRLGAGEDWLPRENRPSLLNGEGAIAFLSLSLPPKTCAGHKRPLAEGTDSEQGPAGAGPTHGYGGGY